MNDFYTRLDGRIEKIDEKIAQVNRIQPVDDAHKEELKKAREQLMNRRKEALTDKQTGIDYMTSYNKIEHLKQQVTQTQQTQDARADFHEKLKQRYGQKYPSSYNSSANTIDMSTWSEADRATYKRSRQERDNAISQNRQKKDELARAYANQRQAADKYVAVTNKIKTTYPANNDLTDPCISCKAVERQKKFDRIKTAFLGKQSFGNCGIQSSNQVINLVNCKKLDETDLLKKSLQNGNAALVENNLAKTNEQRLNEAKNPNAAKAAREKVINDIKPVRNPANPVSSGGIGQRRERLVDQSANLYNKTIIDTSKTGGTLVGQREKIMKDENVNSKPFSPTRANITQALKNNQVMIFASEASKLSPAEDENGKSVESWVATEDKVAPDDFTDSTGKSYKKGDIYKKKGEPLGSGGHAITVADGKFNSQGQLTHVLVSDTGTGKMYYMKIDDFEKSLLTYKDGKPVEMNVSNDPIRMNCP